ncbi:hypothetical protein DL764_001968 [Monosporascus ibericus]|uniref:O-methyltransferase C-terminal domain-containing protein n=1 Tax=Monosporascus ibericus TaxID=155417 RepID=A0A4Q4TP20_9PEZI|nr:hypothetical protein DL764_001968 [Monosporascus ibericus]
MAEKNGSRLIPRSNDGTYVPDMATALTPCDMDNVPTHVEKIKKLAGNISPSDVATRHQLLEAAPSLVRALETPRETMIKHCWAQPAAMTALTLGVDVGLLHAMAADGGSSKTTADLAQRVRVETAVITRIAQHLGAMGYVIETGQDEYKPTKFTTALCIPSINAGYPVLQGVFPVKERLIDGFEGDDGAGFLVDIGGSIGHDIQEFLHKYPSPPGRLILQDLPVVIGQIKSLDEKIERMGYDFTTEQPIKGSRAYYMHSVLHDWPDDTCMKILARITERTEQQWRALLGAAGLKICKIWSAGEGVESLIECELL